MIYDENDEIISVDMYLKQQNFEHVTDSEDVKYYITSYNTPSIQYPSPYNPGPWDDNAHIVFDVPKLEGRY
tara:strand:- start:516 stop:728 length:213 start_codon:yes stop_codon:yes gene_type:complete